MLSYKTLKDRHKILQKKYTKKCRECEQKDEIIEKLQKKIKEKDLLIGWLNSK